jgi:hypothetical protein
MSRKNKVILITLFISSFISLGNIGRIDYRIFIRNNMNDYITMLLIAFTLRSILIFSLLSPIYFSKEKKRK